MKKSDFDYIALNNIDTKVYNDELKNIDEVIDSDDYKACSKTQKEELLRHAKSQLEDHAKTKQYYIKEILEKTKKYTMEQLVSMKNMDLWVIVEKLQNINTVQVNPVDNNIFTLSFNLLDKAKMDIYVYDSANKRIMDIYSGELAGGEHKLEIDKSKLQPGRYFISINGNAQSVSVLWGTVEGDYTFRRD